MANGIQTELIDAEKKHNVIGLTLLGALLFLRFPFLVTAEILFTNEIQISFWVYIIFTSGTYILTAFLIWWERERLKAYWIDLATAITFLCQNFYFIVGGLLFWKMKRSHAWFPTPPGRVWRWGLIGMILAIGVNLLLMTLNLFPQQSRGNDRPDLFFLAFAFFIQTTNAAVWEEPLFRGFLWGYLRQARWPNMVIWIFQALLFTTGHIYYLKDEALFPWFVRMFLPSLIIGLIAWRAKSIFASMLTHGMFNASGDMLLHMGSLSEAIGVCWSAIMILVILLILVWILEIMIHRKSINNQMT